MKKVLLVISLLLSILILGAATAGDTIYYRDYPVVKVFADGKELVSNDVPAFQIDGRTMVPLRLVGEALNATVEWDQATQSVKITKKVTEKPKKELITVSDLSYKNFVTNETQVAGKVKNDNTAAVNVNITIYFYDDRGEIGHIHSKINNLSSGDTVDFNATSKGELQRYTRKEITIDYVEWTV